MIKEIYSLRFIFIFFIFLHHVSLFDGGGTMAVAFCFVLGGFAMTLGYKDKVLADGFSYNKFVKKRCVKFYPLHWLCLLSALPFVINHFELREIPSFVLNAILFQSWIPLQSIYFSYNAVSWYLADTMFFALVFPVLLKFMTNVNVRRNVFFVSTIVLCYVLLMVLLPLKYYHAIFYINPLVRVTDFIVGIYLALLFFRLRKSDAISNFVSTHKKLLLCVFILLIVGLIIISDVLTNNQRLNAIYYWVPICMLILMVSLLGEFNCGGYLRMRWLVYLGECSFVFFMTHQMVIRYNEVLFNKVLHFDNRLIFIQACFLITLMLSVLINNYVLNPLTKWLTQKV